MTPIIFPYKLSSKSAKLLSKTLNTKRVRANGKYKYKNNHLIINWGSSTAPNWNKVDIKILNHWEKVAISHNKLSCLKKLKDKVNTVLWTDDINTATNWIKQGYIVMCRTKLVSHSGFGIVIAKTEQELVNAPLYTKYVQGSEFRLHVAKHGENYIIFDIQKKRKRTDFKGEISPFIRSHRLGYVFCRDNIKTPDKVKEAAIKTLKVLELDFGAIDIKYNSKQNQAYVLECNTSAGLENTTLKNYTDEFLVICQNYLTQ